MLHDPNSRFLDLLVEALRQGKLCVVDLSRMSGEAALAFSGIVLDYLFEHNQKEFVKRDAATIPVIAVLEEAQSVLGQGSVFGSPYVRWVKEGRKYDLGAVMITQQPGSIPAELLSQGDNWFVFHLLSAEDLRAVGRANAHFSPDLLASLLNEPIPGHCVFWSGVSGRPYPIPVRVVSFERMYRPGEKRAAAATCIPALWEAVRARGEGEALEAEGVRRRRQSRKARIT
jgi:DNA helicase HerA-like ATPase